MITETQPSLEIYEGGDLKISAYHFENSLGHPYEDSFKVGEIVEKGGKRYLPLIIADGATRVRREDGTYPSPSPSKELADLICQNIADFLRERLIKESDERERLCFEALKLANSLAWNYNQSCGLEGAELAGTTFTLALVELENGKGRIYWASIGDSPLIIFSSKTRVVNPDQIANFEENKEKLEEHSGKSGRDFSIWHRGNLRNKHYPFEGVDVGYGVLTGEEGAEDYFKRGVVEIRKGDFLLVASDGVVAAGLEILEGVIKDPQLPFEQKLPFAFGRVLTILQNQGKRNDDMTGILMRF